jgi:epoxyqueuosine reductase
MDIKSMLRDEASALGIDVLGFTSCEPFTKAGDILRERERLGYLSGFEEKDILKRINPELLMEGCSTIIAAGISYNVKPELHISGEGFRHRVMVSRSAWGNDYHSVLGGKLNKLSDFIRSKLGGRAMYYVDTGPLVEREVARRAGIGYTGKNCSIINPRYGSYLFLGEILTDIYIEPDSPFDSECGECDLCIRACPSGALREGYEIDAKRCISYLTQSRKVPFEQYGSMGMSVYGCDVCQNACPKNRDACVSSHQEFMPSSWGYSPGVSEILDMDNKKFTETFKNSSAGWRGRKNLQRNTIIALGNSGDKNGAVYIIKMLSDPRRDIREASVYSLYRLLHEESIPIFMEHLNREDDDEIRDIIHRLKIIHEGSGGNKV